MPKGVENLFSQSASSSTTLLPPSPRKTADAGSGDAPRGQTFRKALDKAKPTPNTDQDRPVQQRNAQPREKTTNKKNATSDKSDTPVDQNPVIDATSCETQSDSTTEPTDETKPQSSEDAPVDEAPAKVDPSEETPAKTDENAAAIFASLVVNDAKPETQPQSNLEHDDEQTSQPQVQAEVEHAPARKIAQIGVPKPVTNVTLKKPAIHAESPKPSEVADVADDLQELPEQTDVPSDQEIADTLPKENPAGKNAPTHHDPELPELPAPEVEVAHRAKPALRPVEKNESNTNNEQAVQVMSVDSAEADMQSQSGGSDHGSTADRLAPLQNLSALDTTVPAAKPATTIAVPTNPQPAAPEQDFASNNHDRIVTSMRTQLLPSGGTMHLRLDPPELGVLQLTVRMVDGEMTASFETSNDQATKLLSHSLGQLKQVLETQGVSVEKLHVQQTPSNQQSNSNSEDRQQPSEKENQSARQEQQRREMLQRMWRRLRLGRDPLDTVA